MCLIAMTLAMLVAVMIASNSRKLPKVSWPIESENARIRWTRAAKGMGIGTDSGQSTFIRWNPPQGEHPGNPTTPAAPGRMVPRVAAPGSLDGTQRPSTGRLPVLNSIRRDAGVLDDLRPKRDVGPDDVGELRPGRVLGLASGDVEFFLQVLCDERGLQRLACAVDDRLGGSRRDGGRAPR